MVTYHVFGDCARYNPNFSKQTQTTEKAGITGDFYIGKPKNQFCNLNPNFAIITIISWNDVPSILLSLLSRCLSELCKHIIPCFPLLKLGKDSAPRFHSLNSLQNSEIYRTGKMEMGRKVAKRCQVILLLSNNGRPTYLLAVEKFLKVTS